MIVQGTEILTSLLHIISESLLTPVVIAIVVFIVIVLLCLGSFINEAISRKALNSKDLEELIRKISKSSSSSQLNDVINESNLFKEQKNILITIANNYDIGSEARKALASKLIEEEESNLIKITSKTDVLVRLGPIVGLLGTLIPLGPGLSALGSGDIITLAQSLTIAFDTTVTGLTVGAIAFIISKYRKQWYEEDLSTTEALAETMLENLNK